MISFMTGPKTAITHLFQIDSDGFLNAFVATVKTTDGESDKEIVEAYRQKARAEKGAIALIDDSSIHTFLQGRNDWGVSVSVVKENGEMDHSAPRIKPERVLMAQERERKNREWMTAKLTRSCVMPLPVCLPARLHLRWPNRSASNAISFISAHWN